MVSAVLVEHEDGNRWYHKSVRNQTLIFRWLNNNFWETVNIDPDAITEEASEATLRKLAAGEPLGLPYVNLWKDLFAKLSQGAHSNLTAEQPVDEQDDAEAEVITVPRTRLKAFRFQYRDWNKALQSSTARMFANEPLQLAFLWQNAFKSLQSYQCDAAFTGKKRKALPTGIQYSEQIINTVTAASFFRDAEDGTLPLKVTYVDREIAPLTTPGANDVATCRGGMDLLLRSEDGNVCVGEIKVGNDSELFAAFLQALWYGSEIATYNQMNRLQQHYEGKFDKLVQDHQFKPIDVMVFSIRQEEDETYEPTLKVADFINGNPRIFPGLRSVAFFSNFGNGWEKISNQPVN